MDRRDFIKYASAGITAGALGKLNAAASTKLALVSRPNVLFILTDQWAPNALGYAGDPNVRTPNLDALAAESINFQNAVSVCPVCTPARASLMTGRYPTSTGMFLNDLHLPLDEECLAETFRAEGYDTAYIGKWHLDGHGRWVHIPEERRQGFRFWNTAECDHRYQKSHYYSHESEEMRFWQGYDAYDQTRAAQSYLEDRSRGVGDEPFFLMMSYGGPHFPHETAPKDLQAHYPPAKLKLRPNVTDNMKKRARKELRGYYAHCEAIDMCVGRLLETLEQHGLSENTIVVFTSDHGEMMGSHGVLPKQKQVPWNESAGVPFLIKGPGIKGSRVVDQPINTPDIFPTMVGLAGLTAPSSVEGEDLSPVMQGAAPDSDRDALYMAVSSWTIARDFRFDYRAIRTQRYTYVRRLDGPWLLYDNIEDPYQMKNLVDDPASEPLLAEMEVRLQAQLKSADDDFRSGAEYIAEFGYDVEPGRSVKYSADGNPPQAPNGRVPHRAAGG